VAVLLAGVAAAVRAGRTPAADREPVSS
jgi:hypothetical protein